MLAVACRFLVWCTMCGFVAVTSPPPSPSLGGAILVPLPRVNNDPQPQELGPGSLPCARCPRLDAHAMLLLAIIVPAGPSRPRRAQAPSPPPLPPPPQVLASTQSTFTASTHNPQPKHLVWPLSLGLPRERARHQPTLLQADPGLDSAVLRACCRLAGAGGMGAPRDRQVRELEKREPVRVRVRVQREREHCNAASLVACLYACFSGGVGGGANAANAERRQRQAEADLAEKKPPTNDGRTGVVAAHSTARHASGTSHPSRMVNSRHALAARPGAGHRLRRAFACRVLQDQAN